MIKIISRRYTQIHTDFIFSLADIGQRITVYPSGIQSNYNSNDYSGYAQKVGSATTRLSSPQAVPTGFRSRRVCAQRNDNFCSSGSLEQNVRVSPCVSVANQSKLFKSLMGEDNEY